MKRNHCSTKFQDVLYNVYNSQTMSFNSQIRRVIYQSWVNIKWMTSWMQIPKTLFVSTVMYITIQFVKLNWPTQYSWNIPERLRKSYRSHGTVSTLYLHLEPASRSGVLITFASITERCPYYICQHHGAVSLLDLYLRSLSYNTLVTAFW